MATGPAKPTPLPGLLREAATGHAGYWQNVDATIAPDDEMFLVGKERRNGGDPTPGYLQTGRSAVAAIVAILVLAAKSDVRSILDLPCGHGRVLRNLKARFPEARIVACDLLREGVDFCADQFGAIPVYSEPKARDIPIDELFDLIWVGSLFTHLTEDLWGEFMDFFVDRLEPGGVLVFSTSGRSVMPGIAAEGIRYIDVGDSRPGYGRTIVSPSWVTQFLARYDSVRMLTYWERGWADNQDLVAVVKRPIAGTASLGSFIV